MNRVLPKAIHTSRRFALILLATLVIAGSAGVATAGGVGDIIIPTREQAANVNNDTVGVVFTHEELFHQLVHDMEHELEPASGLRIVPVMGKNHVQSVYDLLYLRGIDLALLRADAIEYVKRKGNYPTIQRVVKSVAKVSQEKVVLISRNEYASIEDLAGQVVGFGLPGSGEYVTGTIVFDTLGIEPVPVQVDNVQALKNVASGELAAMMYLLREPDAVQTGLDLKASIAISEIAATSDLHVIALPDADGLEQVYTPTNVSHDELPGLIEQGREVASYSVDAILAAYQWRSTARRYEKSSRFVAAFAENLDGLRNDEYQPSWKRVDLATTTPNIRRLPLVEEELAKIEENRLARVEAERLAKQAEAERIAAEAEEARQRELKIAELARRRDALTERLGEELNEADAADLEAMLQQLDAFLKTRGVAPEPK